MEDKNREVIQDSLWVVEPPMEKYEVITTCDNCKSDLYKQGTYLKTDDGAYFCDEDCFVEHAYKNY